MQPFGKKYVDQLAMAYLAFEEKSYLPTIVKLVANAIKKDSDRDSASAVATGGDPNADLISFAMSKVRTSVVERVLAPPAFNDGLEKSSVMSKAPSQTKPDTKAAVQSETPRSLPEGGAGKRQPDARGVDEGPAVSGITPTRKVRATVDDAKDLTDLLNRFA
ncbi:hypothetical protein [Bradyrhizobium sp.]|uniref:hypothetical protein n=1 Tax=Bradyrhizobium sp. TaxID=376 RepID=UPI003BAFC942